MKNRFIISEEEKNRILGLHETAKSNPGTVLSEQALGVAFGPEMNGLKIKKVEATEQKELGSQPQVTAAPEVKPKIDQAIINKIESSFPKPTMVNGKSSFTRRDPETPKYDKMVNFLKNTRFGNAVGVTDLSPIQPTDPNAQEIINKGTTQNNYAINALYTGIKSIMNYGFANSLKGLVNYGSNGDAIRSASAEYLDKLGVKYS